MTLQETTELIQRLIKKGEVHQDYDRVCRLHDLYMHIITGEDVGKILIQFVQRESLEAFEQRCRLTKSITGAVANKIMKPFLKVARNKKVFKNINISSEATLKNVQSMIDGFYGSSRNKNKGLDLFMQKQFVNISFTDPNAWLVMQWSADDATRIPKVKPCIVSCKEAVNFSIENDEVKWLFTKTDIKYIKDEGKDSQRLLPGVKYCFYSSDYSVVYTQVDKDGETPLDSVMIQDKKFTIQVNEPKVRMPAAFRVGYAPDLVTKGRTMVNPFHPAVPYFEKMVERVSELDLTMRLHTFPQKFQYVDTCMNKKCEGGRLGDGKECGSCKGTGFRVHTSAQDSILLKLPKNAEGKDLFDLNKLMTYKAPPIDIVNIQREYVKDLETDAIGAIFNSDVFAQTRIAKTATEKELDYDSAYDTLSEFANKSSEIWVDVVTVMCRILRQDNAEVIHKFPADLKLKTQTVLLAELKNANDSGAPSFVRDQINNDIAAAMYSDNDIEMRKYKVKHYFFPFNGKSFDEIALAVTSEHVTRFNKVLYFNYENIFAELERDNPTFYHDNAKRQWELVGEKVNAIIQDLDERSADRFSVSDLLGANRTIGQDAAPPSAAGTNEPDKTDE